MAQEQKQPRKSSQEETATEEVVESDVAERKEEYVITDRGRPVAVLRPWLEQRDGEEARAEQVEQTMSRMRELAKRVAAEATAAGNTMTAAEAVSDQRR